MTHLSIRNSLAATSGSYALSAHKRQGGLKPKAKPTSVCVCYFTGNTSGIKIGGIGKWFIDLMGGLSVKKYTLIVIVILSQ